MNISTHHHDTYINIMCIVIFFKVGWNKYSQRSIYLHVAPSICKTVLQ